MEETYLKKRERNIIVDILTIVDSLPIIGQIQVLGMIQGVHSALDKKNMNVLNKAAEQEATEQEARKETKQ